MGKLLGDSADHRSEQHAALHDRMEYVENLLGDSADKHALWELTHAEQANLQKESEARGEQHAALQERMWYIETLLGDSADQHARLQETQVSEGLAVNDRLEHMAQFVEESFDKHHEQRVFSKEVRREHAIAVEERIEKLNGDSAERHVLWEQV